jgi:hypothetical protein
MGNVSSKAQNACVAMKRAHGATDIRVSRFRQMGSIVGVRTGIPSLRFLALANRKLPVRPNEMAGVAAGISQEVILVLALGLPELAGWNDLGHDFVRNGFGTPLRWQRPYGIIGLPLYRGAPTRSSTD